MSVKLSRALVLLALVPACELYIRSDAAGDDGTGPDSGGLPDAADLDAGPAPIDAPPPPLPNPGFISPTELTRANVFRNGQWQDAGPADLSCLALPRPEFVPPTGYTLSGTVRDMASNFGAAGAAIRATAAGQPVGNATAGQGGMGGGRGTYQMMVSPLPTGTTRIRFTVAGANALTTIAIERYLGGNGTTTLDLPLMSQQTANAIPQFVGEAAEPGAGLVIGEVHDCQGRAVSGAIVALSTLPTFIAHWPHGNTFYFSTAGNGLPVNHATATQTSVDGRFVIINPTPNGVEGTIQAYGYPTDADRTSGVIKLLGRSAAVIAASTATSTILNRAR